MSRQTGEQREWVCEGLDPEQKRDLRLLADAMAVGLTESELYGLAGFLIDAGLDKDPDLGWGGGLA